MGAQPGFVQTQTIVNIFLSRNTTHIISSIQDFQLLASTFTFEYPVNSQVHCASIRDAFQFQIFSRSPFFITCFLIDFIEYIFVLCFSHISPTSTSVRFHRSIYIYIFSQSVSAQNYQKLMYPDEIFRFPLFRLNDSNEYNTYNYCHSSTPSLLVNWTLDRSHQLDKLISSEKSLS